MVIALDKNDRQDSHESGALPGPRELFLLAFDARFDAAAAWPAVVSLADRGAAILHDACAVTRDDRGVGACVEVWGDATVCSDPARGLGFWRLVFQALLGPTSLCDDNSAGANADNAAVAQVTTLLGSDGVPAADVKQVRSCIGPGTTAVALLLSPVDRRAVLKELRALPRVELAACEFSTRFEDIVKSALATPRRRTVRRTV
jgi:uncharacterized membrane protein